MSTSASQIVLDAQTTLQDLTGVRWPASELVRYINDAQREIVAKKPDANAVTASFTCAAGARQALPAASVVLLDVPSNATGKKRAVTRVARRTLDAVALDWISMTEATEVLHYMYDPQQPQVFDVYPPAKAGTSIFITTSVYPTDIAEPSSPGRLWTTVSGSIGLPDEYEQPVRDYVLFRAYSKDAEFGGNAGLAAKHYGLFRAALGLGQPQQQEAAA